MDYARFHRIEGRVFWGLVALGAVAVAIGLGAAYYMEHHGHVVSGMTNQVVWGMPHVFAIFLIVAASGVLNVASIGSVFGKTVYKARAPLSGLLSLAMLAGGLAVLVLDLGRPERLIVAMTHYNFKSIFAWNIFLYTGLFAIVAVYLWTLFDHQGHEYTKPAGIVTFLWRLILTTGTGSIFGFLVARQGYNSALLAPMFIVMSFSFGLAVFIIVQAAMFRWNDRVLHPAILKRMRNLLGIFVAAVLYFTAVHHLTNLYLARQIEFESFILIDGDIYPVLFWGGQVLVGGVIPLLLIYLPKLGTCRDMVLASAFVVLGAFAQLYVLIVGGQSWPLDLFPGMAETSGFYDGQIEYHAPRLPEILLGLGGIGIAFLITTVGVRVLRFLPQDDFAQLETAGNITD
jgi:molybdopterin-containing oxidoreductase family membrane subunit